MNVIINVCFALVIAVPSVISVEKCKWTLGGSARVISGHFCSCNIDWFCLYLTIYIIFSFATLLNSTVIVNYITNPWLCTTKVGEKKYRKICIRDSWPTFLFSRFIIKKIIVVLLLLVVLLHGKSARYLHPVLLLFSWYCIL